MGPRRTSGKWLNELSKEDSPYDILISGVIGNSDVAEESLDRE